MKKFKNEIKEILETSTDEREISENSKLFKTALDKIIYITNMIWFLSIVIGGLIVVTLPRTDILGKVFFSIIMGETIQCFIIDLITFIYIRKTVDKKTFGGTINKKTYLYSQNFIGHIIIFIVCLHGIFKIKINDVLYFSAVALCYIICMLINKFFTNKYKK